MYLKVVPFITTFLGMKTCHCHYKIRSFFLSFCMLNIMSYTFTVHLKGLETFVVFYCTCCITVLCDAGSVCVVPAVIQLTSALWNQFLYPGTLSLGSSPAKYRCKEKHRGKTRACERKLPDWSQTAPSQCPLVTSAVTFPWLGGISSYFRTEEYRDFPWERSR